MPNYFNQLPWRRRLGQLGHCRFMEAAEFASGTAALEGQRIVIVGCGAQGLNQGLCLRDSGLDIGVALRKQAIAERRASFVNAQSHGFAIGSCEDLVPNADLVLNLTPDKQHAEVIAQLMPLMKQGSCLSYSHGFNIVEQGQEIRPDITVIMVAPKCPGTEVREEYLRGFGVPTLIAVHTENDPRAEGLKLASAYAAGLGSHRAGVLESSFVAEVKSDLMGEQTILCGMLQSGSLLCFDHMVAHGIDPGHAARLVQDGWETITEAMKHGGLSNMLARLPNPAKLRAFRLSRQLKDMLRPLYERHMEDILSGAFSAGMMADWGQGDPRLMAWREQTAATAFEAAPSDTPALDEQQHFDQGTLMVAMVQAGVELAFEVMVESGIKPESAYYESLHEVPLIANLISRQRLHEMNLVISDTAEYGCYLFDDACRPLIGSFVDSLGSDVLGTAPPWLGERIDNRELSAVDEEIQGHPVEKVGRELRRHMTAMQNLR